MGNWNLRQNEKTAVQRSNNHGIDVVLKANRHD